jgi:hypothetical protein
MANRVLRAWETGKILTYKRLTRPDGTELWEARVRMRDTAGNVYRPTGYGSSEKAAERRMRRRIREIKAEHADEIAAAAAAEAEAAAVRLAELERASRVVAAAEATRAEAAQTMEAVKAMERRVPA